MLALLDPGSSPVYRSIDLCPVDVHNDQYTSAGLLSFLHRRHRATFLLLSSNISNYLCVSVRISVS